MRRILLYTRPGCHLCDDALDLLLTIDDEMGGRLAIEEVNILEDPALYTCYRDVIPVVAIDPDERDASSPDTGGPTLHAPISAAALRRALSQPGVA
jgi:hypothetical protein